MTPVSRTPHAESPEPVDAYVGLGSNLGDRGANLRAALDHLAAAPGINVREVSSAREYPPWGPVAQPDYLNAVARVVTTLDPRTLLTTLLDVERSLGRDRAREQRWGPRTIDLDLLLYSRSTIQLPGLEVPHPRLAQRRFVLEPLVEIAPGLIVPGLDATPTQLLARLAREG